MSILRPSKYIFLCARRKFGFNKKFCRKLLMFCALPTKFVHFTGSLGWRNLSKTVEKKFLQHMCSKCTWSWINLSFCLSIRLSVQNTKKCRFFTGIKIRVSTWSHLSIVCPLRIPIPICKKKIWVQQEICRNYLLFIVRVLPTNTDLKHLSRHLKIKSPGRHWIWGGVIRAPPKMVLAWLNFFLQSPILSTSEKCLNWEIQRMSNF